MGSGISCISSPSQPETSSDGQITFYHGEATALREVYSTTPPYDSFYDRWTNVFCVTLYLARYPSFARVRRLVPERYFSQINISA